jgi:hypothetical protein
MASRALKEDERGTKWVQRGAAFDLQPDTAYSASEIYHVLCFEPRVKVALEISLTRMQAQGGLQASSSIYVPFPQFQTSTPNLILDASSPTPQDPA